MAINVFTTVNQYYTHCLTSITHNFSLEERLMHHLLVGN